MLICLLHRITSCFNECWTQRLVFLLDNSYFVFTSGFELIFLLAVSWTCRSGSALNTCFKCCFHIPTAISVLYRNRAASSTDWRRWYVISIHLRSFLHWLPHGWWYLAYGVRPVYRNGTASCKSTYGYLAATRWYVHHINKQAFGL